MSDDAATMRVAIAYLMVLGMLVLLSKMSLEHEGGSDGCADTIGLIFGDDYRPPCGEIRIRRFDGAISRQSICGPVSNGDYRLLRGPGKDQFSPLAERRRIEW